MPSPRRCSTTPGDTVPNCTRNDQYILRSNTPEAAAAGTDCSPAWMYGGGRSPPENLHFPSQVHAARAIAVHAAMTGRTGCLIGQWNNALVHIAVAVSERKQVDAEGPPQRDVLESTGRPIHMIS